MIRKLASKLHIDRYFSSKLILFIDLCASVFASAVALMFGKLIIPVSEFDEKTVLFFLLFAAVASFVTFYLMKTNHSIIRHSTLRELAKLFIAVLGKEILLSDGSLDRRAMADRIFADKDARNILESIVTKGVVERIGELIEAERRAGTPALVIDAPTLFETGADSLCDVVWLVTAPEETRLERLSERDGISAESIRARMAGQLSDEEKAARSDVVIENDSNLENLRYKVECLLKNTINMQN